MTRPLIGLAVDTDRRNPYLIEGPALISFSGGRTSGFMLRQILDAHGGTLPDDVIPVFANTGKEMPETLDFVHECGDRWGVNIVWVEYRHTPGKPTFEIVNHNSASRNGEPFDNLISARSMLPNPVTRFCTVELKIRTMNRFGKSLGWTEFDKAVGLRADEPRHAASIKGRATRSRESGEGEIFCPLADAGITVADVTAFWSRQPFDLRLPNINGSTPLGNCDLCFLKGGATLMGIIRERPNLADWWIKTEMNAAKRATLRKPEIALFRADRPSYAKMLELSQTQGDLFTDTATQPCMCHD